MRKTYSALLAILVFITLLLVAPGGSGAAVRRAATVEPVAYENLTHSPGVLPRVYVQDHLSTYWPLAEAAKAWGGTMVIAACRTGQPCVDIYGGNYGATGWVGQTTYGSNGGTIRMNSYGPYMTAGLNERIQAIRHELGHILGLQHDTVGVMFATSDGLHLAIVRDEWLALYDAYGVAY